MKKNATKKVVLVTIMLLTMIGSFNVQTGLSLQPKQAHAQWTVLVAGNTSPTELVNTVSQWMERVKSYVLDGLAWHIAKIMVQQITADTVQWINSGFSGSPAFLSNPEGFFANIGDQVTGAFIANTGILSGLCSPFNVDVRLALALNQAGNNQSYTCTLSSIINNVGNSTINGKSINGFMNGDFSQGGWQGFIAVGNPGNNPGRVYLQAQSDLLQRIGSQQNKYQQQLTQGGGFLSWDSCTDVSASQVAATANATGNSAAFSSFQKQTNQAAGLADITNAQLGNLGGLGGTSGNAGLGMTYTAPAQTLNLGDSSSIKATTGSDGSTKYQDCQTKTPGSVINSQLEKQLGSGVDQLNLANSINQIVDALLAQLVTQVLHSGLSSASQKPSGITQSYIQQLQSETASSSQYGLDANNIQSTLSPYLSNAQQIVDLRQQAVDAFENTKNDLNLAKTCITDLTANLTVPETAKSLYPIELISGAWLNEINTDINTLTMSETTYQTSLTTATTNLTNLQTQIQSASSISNSTDLQNSSNYVQQLTSTQSPLTGDALSSAQNDLSTAKNTTSTYDSTAKRYLNECQMAGGN